MTNSSTLSHEERCHRAEASHSFAGNMGAADLNSVLVSEKLHRSPLEERMLQFANDASGELTTASIARLYRERLDILRRRSLVTQISEYVRTQFDRVNADFWAKHGASYASRV